MPVPGNYRNHLGDSRTGKVKDTGPQRHKDTEMDYSQARVRKDYSQARVR